MQWVRTVCWLLGFVGLCLLQPPRLQASERPPLASVAPNPTRISPRLRATLAEQAVGVPIKVWVYFNDKGISSEAAYQLAVAATEQSLTELTKQRRRLRKEGSLADGYDIPVFSPYIDQVAGLGMHVNGSSRWLNAISVTTTPERLALLSQLSFVRMIEPVTIYRSSLLPRPETDVAEKPNIVPSAHALNYGVSFTQLAQLQVPQLHALGLSGHGITIALFDTGFNLTHEAFDSLRTRVVRQKDFINNDENTKDDPQQDFFSGQHDHGSETLSTIGGYASGQLIGPAYGAQFLLAKTESTVFEQQVEEDWWMEAVEWADSLGADVISSSLGYNSWYQFSDMDGNTAVTTQAAKIAINRGIIVVNSMGNEGQSFWQKMVAPADAEGVISVGAVDSSGILAAFSSRGPTADGRIKPDVVGMGVAVRSVNPNSTNQYSRVNGTSFSTPLVAGTVALLLEAYPSWTPAHMQQVLHATANGAEHPDTLFGYGVVRALNAVLTAANSRIASFTSTNDVESVLLEWHAVREINVQGWRIVRRISPNGPDILLTPTPVPGRGSGAFGSDRTYLFVDTTAVEGLTYQYTLTAVAANGLALTAQPEQTQITFIPSNSSGIPPFSLHQNYPNPFNPSTQILFDVRQVSRITLDVYNVIGQKVRTLVNGLRGPGQYTESWDGTNGQGRPLSSGVYLYRLTAGTFVSSRKMLLIR